MRKTSKEATKAGNGPAKVTLTSLPKMEQNFSSNQKGDGPPMYTCGISYEVTLAEELALDVPLNDLLWDPA
ncbi:hypothetical protein F5887DRAFT_970652 [Amanita rubescens]|nr:hypothetical protein F5887DRAFT_970652 [Amanita rubescens]